MEVFALLSIVQLGVGQVRILLRVGAAATGRKFWSFHVASMHKDLSETGSRHLYLPEVRQGSRLRQEVRHCQAAKDSDHPAGSILQRRTLEKETKLHRLRVAGDELWSVRGSLRGQLEQVQQLQPVRSLQSLRQHGRRALHGLLSLAECEKVVQIRRPRSHGNVVAARRRYSGGLRSFLHN